MYEKRPLRKLRSQLILTFLLGSLGIVIAIGVPVLLLVNQQANSQTRLLLNQAILTTQSSLAREQSDLQNLALLISQRPTLTQLLQAQDPASLHNYLETLRKSVNLDLLVICNADGKAAGTSNNSDSGKLCSLNESSSSLQILKGYGSLMVATADVQNITSDSYKVILGKNSSSILSRLQHETGLLYLLVKDNQVIEVSNPQLDLSTLHVSDLKNDIIFGSQRPILTSIPALGSKNYVLSSIPLDQVSNLEIIGALNVDELVRTQDNLRQTLIFGLILVIFIAFGLGFWLTQFLSSPLHHLANVALDFSHGKLHTPVSIQSSTWEISQLANTLEDARVALEHSLEQLQSEKAWVEHILNSIVEGILTMDSQSQITFASTGVSRIAEDDADAVIGQSVDQLFLPVEGEIPFSGQLPLAGQQQSIAVKLRNGQEKLLSISKAKLVPPEARSSNQALVIRDVTNEEYIHRLLGDFLANITHEFRTPLAALEASSELMLDNIDHLSPSELKDLLVSLNLGIIDLQTLIDNLIEAASIEAGRFKVSRRPVLFESIVEDALNVMQPLAEKYELKLMCSSFDETSITVMADKRRMVQVLVNLLSNAIKHSPESGQIRVDYYVDGQKLHVQVNDEGSGIPVEKRSLLFKRFSHLDSADERARQGAGLGLSVVKAIVDAHQGDVGIKDRTEGGTSFWFTLPVEGEKRDENSGSR